MKIPKLSLILNILLLVAVLSSCSSSVKSLTAEELLDLGEKYLLELNYEEAVVQFTKLREIEPKNSRGYTGLAEAYVGLGDTDKAVAVLKNGLEQLPENLDIEAMLEKLTESDTTDVESDQETATEQMNETMSDPIPENVAIIIDDIKTSLKNESWQKAEELANSEGLVTFLKEQQNESYTASGDTDRIYFHFKEDDGITNVMYACGEKNDSNKFTNGFYYTLDFWFYGKYVAEKIEITDGEYRGVYQNIGFNYDGSIWLDVTGQIENGQFSGTIIDYHYPEDSRARVTKWINGYPEWDTAHEHPYDEIPKNSWLAQ